MPKMSAVQEYTEVFCTPLVFKVALTLMRVDGTLWQLIGWIVCASTGFLSLLS